MRCLHLGSFNGRYLGILLLWSILSGAYADEAADQIERARLLREFAETRPGPSAEGQAPGLPGASIRTERVPASEAGRRDQFDDAHWRSLLGSQQSQIFAPSSQAIPQSEWRSQTFDRDRRADDLSADILRRSREYLTR